MLYFLAYLFWFVIGWLPLFVMTISTPSPTIHRTHFSGLNALRFYAALAVIFSHIDQNIVNRPLFAALIKPLLIDPVSAVNLFFVLSGFLITYLLLQESVATGNVDIRKFYLRRILRIWPLYYLVATIGLLIFPLIFGPTYAILIFYPEYPIVTLPISTQLILVFCFLPNFASITAPMEHLWSIGVEEQFYLWWPWIIRRKLNVVLVCFGVIIIKWLIAPVIYLSSVPGTLRIFNEFRFECMAVGALGAYLYCEKLSWHKWIYHPIMQILAWGVFIYMSGKDMPVNPYASTGMAVVFIVLILNIATNAQSLVRLNHPVLERFGQVSYGLYLYHFPVLFIVLQLVPSFTLFNGVPFYPIGVFVGTFGATWLIAEVSYRWFEKPFLNLKERVGTVHPLS